MKKAYIFILMLVLIACKKIEVVSPIPEIAFKKFTLTDAVDTLLGNEIKLGELEFYFVDGDADIGLDPNVSEEPYKYNLFLTPYQKIDGEYIKIELDTLLPPLNYRIPHHPKMDRVGQNKTIRGEIKVSIQYQIIPPFDTIMYEFYINDRALHSSNIERTSDIPFND